MPQRDVEQQLLESAVGGDRAALSQLLLVHYDSLHRHVSIQSNGQPTGVVQADDILQQTFVRAAQAISTFNPDDFSAFHSWLKTIATNLIKDAVKRRGRERRSSMPGPSQSDDGSFLQAVARLSGDLTPPIQRAQRSESVRRMRTALASLPEDQREIVDLYYLQASSLEEVAEATGRSISAVRGICYRGRKNLRKLMGGSSLYFSN